MANTRAKCLSPEAGFVALAQPERRVDAARGELSQTLSRGPQVWLTAVKRWRRGGRRSRIKDRARVKTDVDFFAA